MRPGALIPGFLVVWCVLSAGVAHAQRIGELRGFKFAEYYAAPRETQMKSLLEGATGRRLDDGTIVVTGAKLQTYKVTGDPEIVIEAPECLHDPAAHTVSSSGPLLVRTADGKFALSGQGFHWGQTNQWLVVSNDVHTSIHGDLMADPAQKQGDAGPGETNAFDIYADRFEYRSETGLANYEHNVRVTGTNVALRSGLMTLEIPMRERQLKNVTAEQDVEMEYAGTRAWGRKVTYDLETGLARVMGGPKWESGARRGSAEEFLIDRTNRFVVATGGAWISLPAQNFGGTTLLSTQPGAVAQPATNQVVEIFSRSYKVQTNEAVFQGPVALTNLADGRPRGSLMCQTLTAIFTGTNQISTLNADRDLVIRQGENEITAANGFYTATNNLLTLTGNPQWRSGERTGKGDILFVDGTRNEMLVKGNASMRLPQQELGSGAGPVNPGTNREPAEIFSQDYTLRPDSATFVGGVYITHPRMAWACETMTVQLPATNAPGHKIVAEQKVYFDLVDEKGQKVNGSAEKAVYTFQPTPTWTNEWLELTGNPVITTTNGTFRNRTITLDRARNKVIAPGHYVIRGLAPGDTNKFTLPKNKWLK